MRTAIYTKQLWDDKQYLKLPSENHLSYYNSIYCMVIELEFFAKQ